MHWNHRVIKYTLPDGETLYAVREVYYGIDDDSNTLNGYADDPDGVQAKDIVGLREYIGWMLKALDKPVLTPADFGLTDEAALARPALSGVPQPPEQP